MTFTKGIVKENILFTQLYYSHNKNLGYVLASILSPRLIVYENIMTKVQLYGIEMFAKMVTAESRYLFFAKSLDILVGFQAINQYLTFTRKL